jgi:hypothetical protein
MLNQVLTRLARRLALRAALKDLRRLGPRERADLPLPRDLADCLQADDAPLVEPLIGPRFGPRVDS